MPKSKVLPSTGKIASSGSRSMSEMSKAMATIPASVAIVCVRNGGRYAVAIPGDGHYLIGKILEVFDDAG